MNNANRTFLPVSLVIAIVLLTFVGCSAESSSGGFSDGDRSFPGGLGPAGDLGSEPALLDPGSDDSFEAADLPMPPLDDSGTEDDLGTEDESEPDEIVDSPEFQSGTLTAGSFDDNLNYDVFLRFLADVEQNTVAGTLPELSLGERIIITVTDDAGRPVSDATVLIGTQEQDDTAFEITTRTDGRVLFLPGVDILSNADRFLVTVIPADGSQTVESTKNIDALSWEITLPSVQARLPSGLDLAFVVDATGSMRDELEYLKTEIDGIAAAVSEEYPEVGQRYALIVYRDEGDLYTTRTFDFTSSLNEFRESLSQQSAAGGGDYPEAMHLALQEAEQLSWQFGQTARVLFLVADAPPHSQFALGSLESINRLRQDGIAIYPVAASGVALEAEFIMRTAAMLTLSQYLFLTDDSGVGNPHAEPHVPCYEVQRLDTLMIRMIATELVGHRINPVPEQVIRMVGNPVDGICMDEVVPGQEQP